MLGKPGYASAQTLSVAPVRHILDEFKLTACSSPRYRGSYADTLSSDTMRGATSQPISIPGTYPSPASSASEESTAQLPDFSPSTKRLSFKEHCAALISAEEYCLKATHPAGIHKSQVGNHLNELFGKFLKEIEKVSLTERPYSLLHEPAMLYSELDFFNTIRCIESPDQRAKLWKRMMNVYNLHVTGPASEIEQKQLATLFFNSAYINHQQEGERILALGRYITANPDKDNSFRYVLANLASIDNAEDQADAARILIGYIECIPFHEQRDAIIAFQDFLPNKISAKDESILNDILDTLSLNFSVKDIEYRGKLRKHAASQLANT